MMGRPIWDGRSSSISSHSTPTSRLSFRSHPDLSSLSPTHRLRRHHYHGAVVLGRAVVTSSTPSHVFPKGQQGASLSRGGDDPRPCIRILYTIPRTLGRAAVRSTTLEHPAGDDLDRLLTFFSILETATNLNRKLSN